MDYLLDYLVLFFQITTKIIEKMILHYYYYCYEPVVLCALTFLFFNYRCFTGTVVVICHINVSRR